MALMYDWSAQAHIYVFFVIVNTTSRIESTGEGGRIHVSQEFAHELIHRGKSDWVIKREDEVEAKGKGVLTTFWLTLIESERRKSMGSGHSCARTAQSSTWSDTPLPRLGRMPELAPLSTVEETTSPLTLGQETKPLTKYQAELPAQKYFDDEISV
jgi:Adenylate and Guanylate cyclase catalytic domain